MNIPRVLFQNPRSILLSEKEELLAKREEPLPLEVIAALAVAKREQNLEEMVELEEEEIPEDHLMDRMLGDVREETELMEEAAEEVLDPEQTNSLGMIIILVEMGEMEELMAEVVEEVLV